MKKIAVIGAGAWGTALAVTAHRAGRKVTLWAHEPDISRQIRDSGFNPYLAGIDLDPAIEAHSDPAILAGADAVLLAAPAQVLRGVCRRFAPHWPDRAPAVICAKGIEERTFELMSETVAEALPGVSLAVLSGPTFAIEVARGLPTAVTLACQDHDLGEALVAALGTPTFRPYLSDDLIGAQIGGAIKNVLAIACGIVEGRGLGDNARAALITRGLAEILRLAVAKGARQETLMGLSGLGDLILTASSMQSRNMSLGVALGRGETLRDIMAARRTVAEGVYTASSVMGLAARLEVELPICTAVNALLHQGADLDHTIRGLLSRPFRTELGYEPARN
ncbi:MAG: NAD(P)-dependent glycerol-3-phosphate dehydrogenase [Rhodospirillales bacterium]|nr:NAD(P)-dependent glycerol-3-phosphate dehydrogenase [Rhodospirillales bacterium]